MRGLIAAFMVGLLAMVIVPVHAQGTFGVGTWQFEDTIGSMSYSGTWSTGAVLGMGVRSGTTSGASVSFNVTGTTLIVWRVMRNDIAASMDLCYGSLPAICLTVPSTTTATSSFSYPFVVSLPGGTTPISINRFAGGAGVINLDYFMVLDSTTASFPTPVPTATILPSSTPAYTATPGPTPVSTATAVPTSTPAPTATPYALPDTIIALEPNVAYSEFNGQIVAFDFRFSGGDVIVAVLLAAVLGVQLFSWWSHRKHD